MQTRALKQHRTVAHSVVIARRVRYTCLILILLAAILQQPVQAQSLEFGPPYILTEAFSVPTGLAVDTANGRVLVADTGNHRVKYAAIADLSLTPTWQEFGYIANRSQPDALNEPQAVAVDSTGNAYVVDTFGNEVQ